MRKVSCCDFWRSHIKRKVEITSSEEHPFHLEEDCPGQDSHTVDTLVLDNEEEYFPNTCSTSSSLLDALQDVPSTCYNTRHCSFFCMCCIFSRREASI
ncbi:hypothetical protein [Methanosarcina horonobensis]|uniref:hypothetical protein n=1 Tax=Methanosarcina horonobensis TaxID=418008 RepID=UPI0013012A79|nr:hypothetical protein [Methanosarcina horonobensis]